MEAEHLYVHVPFCARRCVYCDFSIAVRPVVPESEYVRALAAELDGRHAQSRFTLRTLYFGGGTPSKLGGPGVATLLTMLGDRVAFLPGAEITLEANPEDVTPETVRAWRSAGINRLSLGVQSFDERTLAWMHRTHDADAAHRAIAVARDGGIPEISADLIFATPADAPRSWERDLDIVLALQLPHLSVYGLTVEPRTPLGRWVGRREVTESPEETFEAEFLRAHATLTASGLEHYEVSNYGRPGHHSRHNWSYWLRKPYGGLGPSAHEFDGISRHWNIGAYAAWAAAAESGGKTTEGTEVLDADAIVAEEVYLGLRTNAGLQIEPSEAGMVTPWVQTGWATLSTAGRLILTALGWLRLDTLARDLTHARSR